MKYYRSAHVDVGSDRCCATAEKLDAGALRALCRRHVPAEGSLAKLIARSRLKLLTAALPSTRHMTRRAASKRVGRCSSGCYSSPHRHQPIGQSAVTDHALLIIDIYQQRHLERAGNALSPLGQMPL